MKTKTTTFILTTLLLMSACSPTASSPKTASSGDNAYSYATIEHYKQQNMGERTLIGIKENGAISLYISPGGTIVNGANHSKDAAGNKEMNFPTTPAQETFLYAFFQAVHNGTYIVAAKECDVENNLLEITDGESDYVIHPTCIEKRSAGAKSFLQSNSFSTSGIVFFGNQSLKDAQRSRLQ